MQAAPEQGAAFDEPASYWHATAGAGVPAGELPASADVAVIGGGLLGACATYWLARAGVRVAQVEQARIAYGATGRNGGFMGTGTAEGYLATGARHGREAARALMALTLDSLALLRQVLAEEGIDCDYRECGRVSLALSEDECAAQARTVAALRADGFTGATHVDRARVQELIATPLGPEIAGGMHSTDGGLLHSARFVQGVAAAAQRRGARLAHARVARLVPDGGGVRVETTAGALRAGAAIVAVNAWTDTLVPALRGLVTPVRGQILAYAPLPPVFPLGVGAAVTPTGEYWQQTPDGTIVLGGCRADAPGRDVGVREGVPTPDMQAKIERVLPRLFPRLAGLRVARRWAGLMAFTADYLPVADRAPAWPGVWVTGGFCGHGMPFGMRLGQLLAEAAATGARPAELEPLRIDRPTLAGQ
jgi:gamma-glutamylputrescine oxidase